MGKRLIQQARGKGSPTYRAPSFRYQGRAAHKSLGTQMIEGIIVDFITCQGHSAPLAQVQYQDGEDVLMLAPEGLKVGDKVNYVGEVVIGTSLPLHAIPEGTAIHNIEQQPGDGGKFCRASGTFAKVIGKQQEGIVVQLPSKKQKLFHASCRATIGVIAGGGRTEKPFVKAGKNYHAHRARNKLYPHISGGAQNAVDHPFGNSRSSRKSKARPTSRNAPPGRKVGMIGARRTGRKK